MHNEDPLTHEQARKGLVFCIVGLPLAVILFSVFTGCEEFHNHSQPEYVRDSDPYLLSVAHAQADLLCAQYAVPEPNWNRTGIEWHECIGVYPADEHIFGLTWTMGDGGHDVWIDPELQGRPADIASVVSHEMGHVMGLRPYDGLRNGNHF